MHHPVDNFPLGNFDEQNLIDNISFQEMLEQHYQPLRTNSFSYANLNYAQGAMEQEPNQVSTIRTARNGASPQISQKNIHLSQYYQLSQGRRTVNQLDLKKSYVKVTCVRNSNMILSDQTNAYYINNEGLVDSQKNTTSQDILIGRQNRLIAQSDQIIIPNDIILQEREKIVSRIHCKLICKEFFREKGEIKVHYLQALSVLKLSYNIIFRIAQFLEEPRDVFIQDLGSLYGTHMRISRQEPSKLEVAQQYSIGSDTSFEIMACNATRKGLDSDEGFLKILKQLSIQKFTIQGISQDIINDIKLKEKEQLPQINELIKKLKKYSLPFVAIKFAGASFQESSTNHAGVDEQTKNNHALFIHSSNDECKEYNIGRGTGNHFQLFSNTISRKQSRIFYKPKSQAWFIADGSQVRDSANGTWLSLQTVQQKEKKEISNPKEVRNNTEIKISDYILKIELHRQKNYKTTQEEQLKLLLD